MRTREGWHFSAPPSPSFRPSAALHNPSPYFSTMGDLWHLGINNRELVQSTAVLLGTSPPKPSGHKRRVGRNPIYRLKFREWEIHI